LTVVGTGIRMGLHLTPESRSAVEAADDLLFLNAEPLADAWLASLHPSARSLAPLYRVGAERNEIYAAIVEAVLDPVRAGRRVCAAFYGHPGVFVRPSHEAIRRARAEGHEAQMLPAVSAEDCLFADLGVDPAPGCVSYDATAFVVRAPPIDTEAVLVLWQVAAVGEDRAVAPGAHGRNLAALMEHLLQAYPGEHEVVLYEASPFPVGGPMIVRLPLGDLASASPTPQASLYVAPLPPTASGATPASSTPTV
jgi:uncharacterized protein YabN with tetrapyrrole methylase and pyrophosphatase domain